MTPTPPTSLPRSPQAQVGSRITVRHGERSPYEVGPSRQQPSDPQQPDDQGPHV